MMKVILNLQNLDKILTIEVRNKNVNNKKQLVMEPITYRSVVFPNTWCIQKEP